jgi:cytochrome c biogenesis protein CcmG/thiol:disulfide interchange protein DsbE
MASIRPAFMFPVAIFILLAAIFGIYLYQVGIGGKVISDLPSALIDKPAPTFNLPPIDGDGEGFSSTQLAGKVSLVNVWASWCPPCRVEHPLLMRLSQEGVTIYGINYKDPPTAARAFLKQLGNPFKSIGADRTGRSAIDWGVYGYPETFVIDRTGHIRYRHVGPISADDIDDKFYPLLKALEK